LCPTIAAGACLRGARACLSANGWGVVGLHRTFQAFCETKNQNLLVLRSFVFVCVL
jgi:hypothetical protein